MNTEIKWLICMQSKKKRVGKYLIYFDQMLGSGSFSKVYKALDQSNSLMVAVKVLEKAKIDEDRYTQKALFTQIKILQNVHSPNIIKLLGSHQSKNNYYVFMQLAEGGTLKQLIKNNGPFSQSQAITMFGDILNGFGNLVVLGIVHRDIKPQNILIKQNILKISDFGFARQSDNNSYMSSFLGTKAYMSPQILSHDKYTYKCDIWALGALFYELVVGKCPFNLTGKIDETQIQVLEKIKNIGIVFPQNIKINEKVKQFILNCLKYKEQERYDYENIFNHQLFSKRFKITFDQHCSARLSFIVTDLRMAIHSNNIDLNNFLTKIKSSLDQDNFQVLFKLLHPQIANTEIKILYEYCIKKFNCDKFVKKQNLQQFLKIGGILLPCEKVQHSEIKEKQGQQKNNSFLLFARIKQKINEDQLDLFQLYLKEDTLRTGALTMTEFTMLINKIYDKFTVEQIQILFKQMDTNKDDKISFNQFYRSICKIGSVVQINNSSQCSIFKNK